MCSWCTVILPYISVYYLFTTCLLLFKNNRVLLSHAGPMCDRFPRKFDVQTSYKPSSYVFGLIFVVNIKFPRASYHTIVSLTEELYCLNSKRIRMAKWTVHQLHSSLFVKGNAFGFPRSQTFKRWDRKRFKLSWVWVIDGNIIKKMTWRKKIFTSSLRELEVRSSNRGIRVMLCS